MKDEIIDYALPMILAEQGLKAAHEAALERDWGEARTQLAQASWAVTEAYAACMVLEARE